MHWGAVRAVAVPGTACSIYFCVICLVPRGRPGFRSGFDHALNISYSIVGLSYRIHGDLQTVEVKVRRFI